MTYAELRAQVLENVGHKIHPGEPQLGRVIMRATEHVVNVVEILFKPYNISLTPATISVVTGTLEYAIGAVATTPIRKIYKVERTDNTTDPIDAFIVDFAKKNDYGTRAGSVSIGSFSSRPIVYLRRVPGGDWYLGFPSDPGTSMTIKVYYSPAVVVLSTDASVPREVPEHHHEIIAVRATILLLHQHGIDASAWKQEYAELRGALETDLDSYNRTGPRSRRMRSRSGAGAFI